MHTLLNGIAFFGSGQEWLIVLLVILVLFGGSKIPQLMRGVGRGISEFQEGIREGKDKIKKSIDEGEPEAR
ncbi:MAG: twin-arginine translocase TatA/TatE family subunit [Armatimonadetes bacterium]|nr:twin-arginine translocase TatA/TatE family subunit [Armatimonadota bacterium]